MSSLILLVFTSALQTHSRPRSVSLSAERKRERKRERTKERQKDKESEGESWSPSVALCVPGNTSGLIVKGDEHWIPIKVLFGCGLVEHRSSAHERAASASW